MLPWFSFGSVLTSLPWVKLYQVNFSLKRRENTQFFGQILVLRNGGDFHHSHFLDGQNTEINDISHRVEDNIISLAEGHVLVKGLMEQYYGCPYPLDWILSKLLVVIATTALIKTMIIRASDVTASDSSNEAYNQKGTEKN